MAWSSNAVLFGGLAALYHLTLLIKRSSMLAPLPRLWLPAMLVTLLAIWIALEAASWTPETWNNPLWAIVTEAQNEPVEGASSLNKEATTLPPPSLLTAVAVFWFVVQFGHTRSNAPAAASFPRPSLFLALGLVLSLALGTAGDIGLELLALGFISPKQIEEVLGLPVPRYILSYPLAHASEAVRSLRTGVQMSNVDAPKQVIQVTSALPSEGKSTLAISPALSAAASGQRVLLIEGELRHPSTCQFFGLVYKPALLECLATDTDQHEVLHKDPASGLHVLPAGGKIHHPPDPSACAA